MAGSLFKKVVVHSVSVAAGCAFMTLVVTAAVCGVVGGLLPGEDDDRAERPEPEPSAAARPV